MTKGALQTNPRTVENVPVARQAAVQKCVATGPGRRPADPAGQRHTDLRTEQPSGGRAPARDSLAGALTDLVAVITSELKASAGR